MQKKNSLLLGFWMVEGKRW